MCEYNSCYKLYYETLYYQDKILDDCSVSKIKRTCHPERNIYNDRENVIRKHVPFKSRLLLTVTGPLTVARSGSLFNVCTH